MRNVRKIEPSNPMLSVKKRVAAYTRVSTGKDSMIHSLSAQVSYYSEFIQKHHGWEYVGVYTDAMTGTTDRRAEFQRLLCDCREGKIDMIITKSISRFARNTITMLETVRELKNLKIDVFFEKENIHSMSGDGELMLTILASFAQEESLSVSENRKWRIRNKFKDGIPSCATMLGYRLVDGILEIVPEEAEVVKRVFADYLNGMGRIAIAKKLKEDGMRTRTGGSWFESSIERILKNEKYTGDMLLQKTFNSNHIEKKKRINQGELPMYHVKNSHEPIIDRDTFECVQEEIKRRAAKYHPSKQAPRKYPFSSKITCSKCDKNFRRRTSGSGKYRKAYWICPTYNKSGKAACPSKQIPEDILRTITIEILGLSEFEEKIFKKQIKQIITMDLNRLVFVFTDGNRIQKTWQNKSRKDSWSEKDREQAREHQLKCIERGEQFDFDKISNSYTSKSRKI